MLHNTQLEHNKHWLGIHQFSERNTKTWKKNQSTKNTKFNLELQQQQPPTLQLNTNVRVIKVNWKVQSKMFSEYCSIKGWGWMGSGKIKLFSFIHSRSVVRYYSSHNTHEYSPFLFIHVHQTWKAERHSIMNFSHAPNNLGNSTEY